MDVRGSSILCSRGSLFRRHFGMLFWMLLREARRDVEVVAVTEVPYIKLILSRYRHAPLYRLPRQVE